MTGLPPRFERHTVRVTPPDNVWIWAKRPLLAWLDLVALSAEELDGAAATRAQYENESRRFGWRSASRTDQRTSAPGIWEWDRYDLFALLEVGILKWSERDSKSGRTVPVGREILQRLERSHPEAFGWMVDKVLEISQQAGGTTQRKRRGRQPLLSLNAKQREVARKARRLRGQGKTWENTSALCEHHNRKTLNRWIALLECEEATAPDIN